MNDLHKVTKRSDIGQNGFFAITFDRIKIETWDQGHCDPLVETRRMIGHMTYLGQGHDLT